MSDFMPLLLSKKKAAEYLGCSVEELLKWVVPDRVVTTDPGRQGMRLNRWANDGRMPADGAIHLCMPRSLDARAWLPTTVESAKAQINDWRKKDSLVKTARRTKPRIIRGAAPAGTTRPPKNL
jgi:hypothetical protein